MSPGPCRLVACLSRGPACSRPLRAHARRGYWTVECTPPITVADAPRNAPALPGHGAANRCDGDYVLNADGAGAADATASLPLPSRARGPGALRACDPYADPTPEMVDAGVAVLATSGAVEGQLHSDDLLVASGNVAGSSRTSSIGRTILPGCTCNPAETEGSHLFRYYQSCDLRRDDQAPVARNPEFWKGVFQNHSLHSRRDPDFPLRRLNIFPTNDANQ